MLLLRFSVSVPLHSLFAAQLISVLLFAYSIIVTIDDRRWAIGVNDGAEKTLQCTMFDDDG